MRGWCHWHCQYYGEHTPSMTVSEVVHRQLEVEGSGCSLQCAAQHISVEPARGVDVRGDVSELREEDNKGVFANRSGQMTLGRYAVGSGKLVVAQHDVSGIEEAVGSIRGRPVADPVLQLVTRRRREACNTRQHEEAQGSQK